MFYNSQFQSDKTQLYLNYFPKTLQIDCAFKALLMPQDDQHGNVFLDLLLQVTSHQRLEVHVMLLLQKLTVLLEASLKLYNVAITVILSFIVHGLKEILNFEFSYKLFSLHMCFNYWIRIAILNLITVLILNSLILKLYLLWIS